MNHRKSSTPTTAGGPLSALTVEAPLIVARRLRAMNTDVEITVLDMASASAAADAEVAFTQIERRFSRFDPHSELSLLNALGGGRIEVSDDMLELIELVMEMRQRTGGIFDPAILPDLIAAGYDRSFELVEDSDLATQWRRKHEYRAHSICIDREHATIELPNDVQLDFGGIGKGYAVDRAAGRLRRAGNFLINAGGDIRAGGDGIDGDGWLASVVHPMTYTEVDRVRLHDEALATSTTAVRRWKRAGVAMHHIIDPRTGEPARSDVRSASVIARTAVEAEVFAKTALILGRTRGFGFLRSEGVAGLFVLEDGTAVASESWPSVTVRTGGRR